ncbi:MAG: hypothetical protein H6560_20250 [Lewinellaceae bacterium]|nr:hypothetical protein [Lewinellaceae bacterium]
MSRKIKNNAPEYLPTAGFRPDPSFLLIFLGGGVVRTLGGDVDLQSQLFDKKHTHTKF